MVESRMRRFKLLHDQVNKDINRYAMMESENDQIASVMSKLDLVDKRLFREKFAQFMHDHQLEKPYLETFKNNLIISENELMGLKLVISELRKVENRADLIENREDDSKSTSYFDEESKKLEAELNSIVEWLNMQIEKLNSKTPQHNPIAEKISMSSIHQVRSKDERTMSDLMRDIDVSNKEIDAKRLKLISQVGKTKQMKFVKVLLPIMIAIIVAALVAIALVMFL